jgi:hypothetical protein
MDNNVSKEYGTFIFRRAIFKLKMEAEAAYPLKHWYPPSRLHGVTTPKTTT